MPGGTEETDGKSISRYRCRDSNPYLLPNRSQKCLPFEPAYLVDQISMAISHVSLLRCQNCGFAKNIRDVCWYFRVSITEIGSRMLRPRGGLYLCFYFVHNFILGGYG